MASKSSSAGLPSLDQWLTRVSNIPDQLRFMAADLEQVLAEADLLTDNFIPLLKFLYSEKSDLFNLVLLAVESASNGGKVLRNQPILAQNISQLIVRTLPEIYAQKQQQLPSDSTGSSAPVAGQGDPDQIDHFPNKFANNPPIRTSGLLKPRPSVSILNRNFVSSAASVMKKMQIRKRKRMFEPSSIGSNGPATNGSCSDDQRSLELTVDMNAVGGNEVNDMKPPQLIPSATHSSLSPLPVPVESGFNNGNATEADMITQSNGSTNNTHSSADDDFGMFIDTNSSSALVNSAISMTLMGQQQSFGAGGQQGRRMCLFCEETFSTSGARNRHETYTCKKNPNALPRVPCEQCGKMFKRRDTMIEHAQNYCSALKSLHPPNVH